LPANLPQRDVMRPVTVTFPYDVAARPSAFAASEYCAAMQQTQIRLNRNLSTKVSSQFAFDCFAWGALHFSRTVDVL